MSLESHLTDATFGESMADNGFDYFEVRPHEFDFGAPENDHFLTKNRPFSVIFAQNLDFVNSDVVQIQPRRKVELGTIVCP